MCSIVEVLHYSACFYWTCVRYLGAGTVIPSLDPIDAGSVTGYERICAWTKYDRFWTLLSILEITWDYCIVIIWRGWNKATRGLP
jgi:hypothetical protein